MSAAAQRKFPWKAYWLTLLAIMLFAMLPVFVVIYANILTGGPVHLPEIMASMGLFGWFLLAPFTLGGMAFCLWILVLIVHLLLWRRRRQ
jgi:hypothetical protein